MEEILVPIDTWRNSDSAADSAAAALITSATTSSGISAAASGRLMMELNEGTRAPPGGAAGEGRSRGPCGGVFVSADAEPTAGGRLGRCGLGAIGRLSLL